MLKMVVAWKQVTKCPDKQNVCPVLAFKWNMAVKSNPFVTFGGAKKNVLTIYICIYHTHSGTLVCEYLKCNYVMVSFHYLHSMDLARTAPTVESAWKTPSEPLLSLLHPSGNVLPVEQHPSLWEPGKYP